MLIEQLGQIEVEVNQSNEWNSPSSVVCRKKKQLRKAKCLHESSAQQPSELIIRIGCSIREHTLPCPTLTREREKEARIVIIGAQPLCWSCERRQEQ